MMCYSSHKCNEGLDKGCLCAIDKMCSDVVSPVRISVMEPMIRTVKTVQKTARTARSAIIQFAKLVVPGGCMCNKQPCSDRPLYHTFDAEKKEKKCVD